MKKSRYSDSQILNILRQAENGVLVPELCREHGTSSATRSPWLCCVPAKRPWSRKQHWNRPNPAKDWSRHGLDYAAKTAIRSEHAEKERELHARGDISSTGQKTLQAFLCMEQIAAEACAEGAELGRVKRRVDGKGVVIFTLDSGGTIRDTGKEVFYSGRDLKTKHAAKLYAEKKWGKHISLKKDCITFQSERKIGQAALIPPNK